MATQAPSPKPWWRQFVSQYLAPTAFATVVATILSVYTALNAQRDKEREFSKSFETLITGTAIMNAFKGSDVAEQQAASQLLALQAVADTSAQRRTVLLIGARLLNANSDSDATGAPAARLLTILIDQDKRSADEQMRGLIASQPFLDLVTAGYDNDYYNDDLARNWFTWPTLNGDQPISHEAKLLLLRQLTASNFDGWLHVATFLTTYRFANAAPAPVAPQPKEPAIAVERAEAPLGTKTTKNFLEALNEVNRQRDVSRATNLLAQYAILPPEGAPAQTSGASPQATPTTAPLPLFKASALVTENSLPSELLMLKPRLLRDRPPVEFVNPDGTFHKGSLGTIVGAVPAATCVKLVEPMHPVLVFVTAPMSSHIPGAKSAEWTGLIHMWAHVQPSSGCAGTTR